MLAPWLPFQSRRVGDHAAGNTVVMLTISDLRIDPRIEREARALATGGYTVFVVAPNFEDNLNAVPNIDWGKNVRFDWVRLKAVSFANTWPGFLAREIFNQAIHYQPFCFHAHDLFTAFAGLSAARKTGAHLICDFHEWGSENVHWNAKTDAWLPYPKSWKLPLRWLERRCLREASEIITVCESIASHMATELGRGRKPQILRNIPPLALEPTKGYPPLKEQLALNDDNFVLIWQGGTGPTRLLEPVIEALKHAPRCILVIRGPSLDLFGESYAQLAREVDASERLVLLPPVPSRDVVAAARGADAGIWTLPNLSRNFYYALPNKIFEYLASELPILVADYPEPKRIVNDFAVGLTFDPYDPKSIAASINQLIDDPKLADRCRTNTTIALTKLNAKMEWSKLVDIYDGLPRTSVEAS